MNRPDARRSESTVAGREELTLRDDVDAGAADVDAGGVDIDWVAWRYLLDELDAQAAAEFEGRLADDEAAAVALANAARLHEAIIGCRATDGRAAGENGSAASRAAPRNRARRTVDPVRRERARRDRAVACTLAAVAAAVLLVVIVGGQSARTVGRSKRAADLVRLWAAAAPDLAPSEETVVEEVGAIVDDVPDWLRTAVALDSERRAAEAARGMDPAADDNDVL